MGLTFPVATLEVGLVGDFLVGLLLGILIGALWAHVFQDETRG